MIKITITIKARRGRVRRARRVGRGHLWLLFSLSLLRLLLVAGKKK
jgi:hypothetical protein